MNAIEINQTLSNLPEGIPVEKRRLRISAVLAIATSVIVTLPSTTVGGFDRRSYFYDNAAAVREVFFNINEVIPFSVDQTLENAYRIWAKRYDLSFAPLSDDLIAERNPIYNAIVDTIAGYQELAIQGADIRKAIELIRNGLAA